MEKKIDQILKTLEYHSKLLEELTFAKDETRGNAKTHIDNMMANLTDHPALKENPIMANMVTQMFNTLTKGMQNDH